MSNLGTPENLERNLRFLHRQRVAARVTTPRYVAQTVKFDVTETIGDALLAQVTAEVLQEKIVGETKTVALYVPESWWQHLKQAHAPSWFLKHRPVRLRMLKQEVTFERYYNYPDASIALPPEKFGMPVVIEQVTQSGWFNATDES